MTEERRRQPRREQYFECTWVADWGEERGRVSSLSITGCYIETRGTAPAEGTPLSGTITLPSGDIAVQGTVVNVLRGVGFAVQFTDLDEDVQHKLAAL